MKVTPEPAAKTRDLIFVNYRRDDAEGVAGRLYDRLKRRFGRERVFMDVTSIPPGVPFPEYIKNKIADCAAVLVVIGPRWLNCPAADGHRRLDDPKDFVRTEIAAALLDVETRVIPVLVKGAVMPREEELPDGLKPLAFLEALEVSNERWQYDTKQLLAALEEILPPPPPPSGLWEWIRHYWRLFPVRLVTAALLLAVVLAVQAYLAYHPEPVNLDATGRFSPASVKFGREVLTIEAPQPDPEGLLLAHVANANEVVELGCESGRLDGSTLMLFSKQNPPTRPSRVDFLTTRLAGPVAGEPCRTFVQVRAADAGRPPSALRFYQQGSPSGDVLRSLWLKADGELLLGMDTVMSDESQENSPGCRKLLRVGEGFESHVNDDSTIALVAAPDSGAGFTFSPVTAKEPLFTGAGGGFEPFSFGSDGTLRARAIEIVATGANGAGPEPVLAARGVEGGEPLRVESLLVNPDRLEVKVSGLAFVEVSGHSVTDPLGRINRRPLLWLLLVVADAVLLAWLIHLLFGRRGSSV